MLAQPQDCVIVESWRQSSVVQAVGKAVQVGALVRVMVKQVEVGGGGGVVVVTPVPEEDLSQDKAVLVSAEMIASVENCMMR